MVGVIRCQQLQNIQLLLIYRLDLTKIDRGSCLASLIIVQIFSSFFSQLLSSKLNVDFLNKNFTLLV